MYSFSLRMRLVVMLYSLAGLAMVAWNLVENYQNGADAQTFRVAAVPTVIGFIATLMGMVGIIAELRMHNHSTNTYRHLMTLAGFSRR